jgi:ribosomal protein S18 acetylase RimI-like enzyme
VSFANRGIAALPTDTHPWSAKVATAEDVEPLSLVFMQAFQQDPFHRWILPTEKDWRRKSRRCWAAYLKLGVRACSVFCTPGHEGGALWLSPHWGQAGRLERALFSLRMLVLLGFRAAALAHTFAVLEGKHPREPHWYLVGLATDPTRQRKGVGAFLMSHVLGRIDEESSAAYLEASAPSNVPYYRRFGFEVREEFQLPKGPPVWLMSRPGCAKQGKASPPRAAETAAADRR